MKTFSLYTNQNTSDKFIKKFEATLANSDHLEIASGYIGASTIITLESKLVKIAQRGSCKLLIGMIYHGGVTKKQLLALASLDSKLRATGNQSGVYISRVQYHGKIYQFSKNQVFTLYLGSSNFSKEGLESRLEATTQLKDKDTMKEVSDYLSDLFFSSTTSNFQDVELRVKGFKSSLPFVSKELEDYEINASKYPDIS